MALMNGNYSLPVNLGNPDEYSVKDFAHLIKELTNSNSTIKFLPSTTDDPKQRKPDITVAREKIGWKPTVPVRIGLEKAIAYFRSELEQTGEIVPTGPDASRPNTPQRKMRH
jgi:UDP-glucuronate decarboxylase